MLAPITEAWPGEQEVLELGAASLAPLAGVRRGRRRRRRACRSGCAREGTVQVATDAADVADLDRVVEHLRGLGPRRRAAARPRAAPSRARARARGARRACRARRPRRRQPRAARRAARPRAGAPGWWSRGVAVSRVLDDGVRVTGVELDGEVLEADRVVVAAGAWSARAAPVARRAGAAGEGRDPAACGRGPRRCRRRRAPCARAVDGRPVYAVPRDGGRLVVGATQYEAGFDPDVIVGGVRDLVARRRAGPAGHRGVRPRGDRRRRSVRAPTTTCRCSGPSGPDGPVRRHRARAQRDAAGRRHRRRVGGRPARGRPARRARAAAADRSAVAPG